MVFFGHRRCFSAAKGFSTQHLDWNTLDWQVAFEYFLASAFST
jgi:hypothetical protein